jgi:hypothetical protein
MADFAVDPISWLPWFLGVFVQFVLLLLRRPHGQAYTYAVPDRQIGPVLRASKVKGCSKANHITATRPQPRAA